MARKSNDDKQRALSDALHAAGIDRYADKSYDSTINAMHNLESRTHYVDPDTRRFFHSRITYAGDHYHGLIFTIVESIAADPDNRRRGFRYVIFDVFGTVIDRVSLDGLSRTDAQARRAMYAALDALDVLAHYRDAIDGRVKRKKRELSELSNCRRCAR